MADRQRRIKKEDIPDDKNDLITYMKNKISDDISNLDNKIETKIHSLEGRIDVIDESIRGNGRVGYSEQIRNLKRVNMVLICAIIWLAGFELGGVTLKQWIADILHIETKAIKAQVEEEVKEQVEDVNKGDENKADSAMPLVPLQPPGSVKKEEPDEESDKVTD